MPAGEIVSSKNREVVVATGTGQSPAQIEPEALQESAPNDQRHGSMFSFAAQIGVFWVAIRGNVVRMAIPGSQRKPIAWIAAVGARQIHRLHKAMALNEVGREFLGPPLMIKVKQRTAGPAIKMAPRPRQCGDRSATEM